MRILLVENDAAKLCGHLKAAGCRVDVPLDQQDAEEMVGSVRYDILILNLELLEDSLSLLRRWCRAGIRAHILALTAGSAESILALDYGADFAMEKSYPVELLLAQVRAIARRRLATADQILRIGDLEINKTRRTVRRAGQVLYLSQQRFNLLYCLATRPGATVSHREILRHIGFEEGARSNIVAVLVRFLRNELDQAFNVQLIVTVSRKGYMLVADPKRTQPLMAYMSAAASTPAQSLHDMPSDPHRTVEYHPSAP